MRGEWVGLICLLGALHVVDCPNAAHAQESAAKSRRVKGHVFLLPTLQDSAFVTTHVGVREGFATYDVPDVPLGRFGTRDVTLNGIQQSFDLGLGLTDWLGVYGFGRATLVTGIDAPSLIVDGASVDFVGSLGAVVRLLRNEHTGTQVALRARADYSKGRDITVQPLVVALTETGAVVITDVSDGDLGELIFVPSSETSVHLSAHAAQFITDFLSAQAALTADRGWATREPFLLADGRRPDEDSDTFRLHLAAALELDFSKLFPMSLLAEYRYTNGERTQDGRPDTDLGMHGVGLGVYYVGRPNLQLGVSAATTLSAEPRRGIGPQGETELSGDPSLTYVELILRYVW